MNSMGQAVSVLLVEDDDVDIELVQRAFSDMKISNPIVVAADGLEALEILRGEHESKKIDRPFMILLDLNMPRMDWIEFLNEVRDDRYLRDSIIFVLTTSDADRDKVEAYQKNIAGYLVKSKINPKFAEIVHMLDGYWRYVEFPPESER